MRIDPAKVDPTLYFDRENVPVVDEATQARYYVGLINLVKCDPTVQTLDLFHLIDEPSLLGFQSGLLRVDGSLRPSYAAVKRAIAAASICAAQHAWHHTTAVIGARSRFNVRPKPAVQRVFWSTVATGEEATAETAIFPADVGAASSLLRQSLDGGPVEAGGLPPLHGLVRANSGRSFKFHGRLAPGRYVFAALLRATMNPIRTTLLVSRPFSIR